jgi:hypothetical protein
MQLRTLFRDFPTEEELMDLIMHTSLTVWKNAFDRKDIENWLGNFQGEVLNKKYERLIALWLLGHFTYYNQDEVSHLCKVLYQDLKHLIVKKNPSPGSDIRGLIHDFFSKTNILSFEKISGSGGFIAYFFRHENNLPMTIFNFSIENVNEQIENILIIDDVTLTAGKKGQMYRFWKNTINKYPQKNFYLLTLVSSDAAFNFLKSEFNIEVVTAIKLDSRDKCFHSESDIFSQFPDLTNIAKSFAEHYGKKLGITHPLGYENGQYTFGFFYNTPDNTLPIFWGRLNNWVPIISRYHKNYGSEDYLGNERFI